jgi:hypothetical protein
VCLSSRSESSLYNTKQKKSTVVRPSKRSMFSTKAIHSLRFSQRTSRRAETQNKQTKSGRQCPRIIVLSEPLRSMLQHCDRATFSNRCSTQHFFAVFPSYLKPLSSSPMIIPFFFTMASFASWCCAACQVIGFQVQ